MSVKEALYNMGQQVSSISDTHASIKHLVVVTNQNRLDILEQLSVISDQIDSAISFICSEKCVPDYVMQENIKSSVLSHHLRTLSDTWAMTISQCLNIPQNTVSSFKIWFEMSFFSCLIFLLTIIDSNSCHKTHGIITTMG